MTDEQINIAIAEHCGWKEIRLDETHHIYGGIEPDNGFRVAIPNYCKNLNAMREAEKTLTGPILDRYVDNCMVEVEHWPSHLLYLSARRRAEAFLQTIGKWEEA